MARKRQGVDLARSIGTSLGRADQTLDRLFEDDIHLRSMTVRTPEEGRGDFFVICRWWVGGQAKVSYNSAGTFWEAVKGAVDRMHNSSFVMKDDQYA